ncbi:hypothetical protein BJV78DRAFT_1261402 [Lactifluus subvellereus]|nr:hypothetical protein BJV78DRAFT_1261402 [Lactifluus subvellereus]
MVRMPVPCSFIFCIWGKVVIIRARPSGFASPWLLRPVYLAVEPPCSSHLAEPTPADVPCGQQVSLRTCYPQALVSKLFKPSSPHPRTGGTHPASATRLRVVASPPHSLGQGRTT